jgi:hypothetical protein
MTASFMFGSSARRRRTFMAAIVAAAIAPHFAEATELVIVHLDQARISRLPERVSTIVIGNPLIADVSLQAGGLMVLTGKGYGVTNLIALDREGAVLSEFLIQVQAAADGVVVVYRGDARESYSCTPVCEPRIALGDAPPYFDAIIGQTGSRTGRAQGSGSTGPAPGQGAQGAPAR